MTRTRSVAALLIVGLASGGLLLAPSAQAHTTSRTITLAPSPNAALISTPVTFAGKLSRSPVHSTVKIQLKVGKVWKSVATTYTKTASGSYAKPVKLPAKAGGYSYRAYAPKHGSLGAATSHVRKVVALRKTTFFQVSNNDFLMQATGKGMPGSAVGSLKATYTAGAKVTLQRRPGTSGPWTTLGTSTIASNGTFKVNFPDAENGNFRVLVDRKGLNAAATSKTEGFVFP